MVVAHAKRVEIVPVTRVLSKRGKCSACLADMAKEVDSPDRHPLGNVQVPCMVKAGIMRMNETPVLPASRLPTHGEIISQHLFAPHRVIPQVGNHVVVFVQQGNASMKIGNDHD